MNAVLLCPGRRAAVALLAESQPLTLAPLLGRTLLEYWIEYLAGLGVARILIAAADRPDQVRALVGDGARWGLRIEITEETAELTEAQASERYSAISATTPDFIVRMDHLPGHPGLYLFTSYASWFVALEAWIPRAQVLERIGQCEVQPGVWIGLRVQLDPAARLIAPCWLGDHVSVTGDAVIGPGAILEEGVVVAAGARIARSVIGPATFVGARARVENSLAHRETLINWHTDSCLRVPDAFWLGPLGDSRPVSRPFVRPEPLKVATLGQAVRVSGLAELSETNAGRVLEEIQTVLASRPAILELDLSETRYLDSGGLAALCSLRRTAETSRIALRLLHPDRALLQLLELTQLRAFFGIEPTEPSWPGTPGPLITRPAPARDSVPASPASPVLSSS